MDSVNTFKPTLDEAKIEALILQNPVDVTDNRIRHIGTHYTTAFLQPNACANTSRRPAYPCTNFANKTCEGCGLVQVSGFKVDMPFNAVSNALYSTVVNNAKQRVGKHTRASAVLRAWINKRTVL